MADDFTRLNLGSGGDAMDEAGITYPDNPTVRKRPRIILTGENKDEKAVVRNTDVDSSDYGLVVRNVPSCMAHPGWAITEFNEATLVPDDTETTIVTYTVPAGHVFYLTSFLGSGDINGRYMLYLNGELIIQGRTTAANLNVELSTGIVRPSATEGEIVTITVIHSSPGLTPNFNATILGYTVLATY